MATAAAATLQTAASLTKLIRKTVATAREGFNFMSDEINAMQQVPKDEIPPSLREMLFPVDLNETGGVASLPDFGQKARPSVTGLEEGLGYLVHLNKRFNQSTLAKLVAAGQTNQVIDQFKFQASKSVKALGRAATIMWWGSSSGVLALTDTDLTTSTSQTLTLRAAFGITGQDNAAYLADLFATMDAAGNEGDGVAVMNGATIKGYGLIASKDRVNGTITITFDVAPTADATNGLAIVLLNAIGSLSAQTNYNKAMTGWTDGLTVTALHGITHAEWLPAVYGTTSVRFSPVLYQQLRDEVNLRGGGKLTHLFWDAGVKRDAWDNRVTLQRFNDTSGFTLDGDISAKGVENVVTRTVPAGWVTGFDAKRAATRVQVTELPSDSGTGGVSQDDGIHYIDQAGKVYEMNLVMALQWRNRRCMGGYINKTRQ